MSWTPEAEEEEQGYRSRDWSTDLSRSAASKLLKNLAGGASLLESTERLMMMMMMFSNASHAIHTSSRSQTYIS